tara:strand:+ start:1506 stop:1724 length:219 start_codon:yes stop_codon:yes gene_type:complete
MSLGLTKKDDLVSSIYVFAKLIVCFDISFLVKFSKLSIFKNSDFNEFIIKERLYFKFSKYNLFKKVFKDDIL